MSIFSPSRGTGSFGKGVESMGSLFPAQAAATTPLIPSSSASSAVVSAQAQATAAPSQSQGAAVRSPSGSGVRVPQRARTGTVQAGRTRQTVSSTGTRSSQSSSSTQRTPVQKTVGSQGSPVTKRVTVPTERTWAGPKSTFKVLDRDGHVTIFRNDYKYFPIVSDQDLPLLGSAVKWNLFSKLASDIRIGKPSLLEHGMPSESRNIEISLFRALGLDLRRPAQLTPETRSAYASMNLPDSSHIHDIPLAVFDLMPEGNFDPNWWIKWEDPRSGGIRTDHGSKRGYLLRVTRQLRELQSKRDEILQAMFQMFMDAHFPTYTPSMYTQGELRRFASFNLTLQPLSDATAKSARREIYDIWGGCFQRPQEMSEVSSPIFSKSEASVSGGKVVLNTGRQNAFPLGDFLSVIAFGGYLKPNSQIEGFGANFYAQNPSAAKLDFSNIYNASTATKRGYMDTLQVFVNASTMVKAYPQEIGTGNLAYRVARAQYPKQSGSKALLHFLSTGRDHPNISAPLKTQAPELGSAKNSSRFVDMSLLFSTLFLIDFMSCKDRKVVRSNPRYYRMLGTNFLGDHVRNFLNWIPQRAEYVARLAPPRASAPIGVVSASRRTSAPTTPSAPILTSLRPPSTSTSTASGKTGVSLRSVRGGKPTPSKGGKTKVGLTPVRKGKSMSPFRSTTAALARKQGKPTQSAPSRRSGVASAVAVEAVRRTQQPKFATVSDVLRVLAEPNIKRTLQHVELPLEPKTVLAFGEAGLGRPLTQSFVDDLILGMIGFWVMYPEMTASVPQMVGSASKLMSFAKSDTEFAKLVQGLEDMLMLDDPEFTKAMMQLPRRTVAPVKDNTILAEIEIPADDPSLDEVIVDVVTDPSTGDVVAIPVEDADIAIPAPPSGMVAPEYRDHDMDPVIMIHAEPPSEWYQDEGELVPTPSQPVSTDLVSPIAEPISSGGGSSIAEDQGEPAPSTPAPSEPAPSTPAPKSEKKPSDAKSEDEVNYTPWIIGGVATIAIGTGVFMYMNKRKRSI